MNIKNGNYRVVSLNALLRYPVKAGTPLDFAGNEANNENAVGIVPQTITERPAMAKVTLLVGGDVDLTEVEKEYGAALQPAAIKAMYGINFYRPDGQVEGRTVTIPAATTTSEGLVKMAANVAEAEGEAPTAAEFNALLDALIAAGIMAPPAET